MFQRHYVSWLLVLVLTFSVLAVAGTGCTGQAKWPTKAIELTVASAAGGGSDVVARIAARYLSAKLGQPVNVVNKAGANMVTGVLSVMGAPPDGYALLWDLNATSSLHAALKNPPYKVEERTFGPMMVAGPMAIAVNAQSPWNSLKDLTEAAKKDPANFTWGRIGGSATADVTIMKLLDAGGVDLNKTKPVAFDGAGPSVTAVGGGHVMLGSDGPAGMLALLSAGKIKVLAVTGEKRISSLPNVPSTTEAGFPTVDVVTWFGISGPKELNKDVLARLDAEVKAISQDPAFAKEMEAAGRYVLYKTPAETKAYFEKEAEGYKALFTKFPGFN